MTKRPVFSLAMKCPKCGQGSPNSFHTEYVPAGGFFVKRPDLVVWRCYFCRALIECIPISPPQEGAQEE